MKGIKGVALTCLDLVHPIIQKLVQRLLKHLFTNLVIQASRGEFLKAKKKMKGRVAPMAQPNRVRESTST